jgi:hypothetical protein
MLPEYIFFAGVGSQDTINLFSKYNNIISV